MIHRRNLYPSSTIDFSLFVAFESTWLTIGKKIKFVLRFYSLSFFGFITFLHYLASNLNSLRCSVKSRTNYEGSIPKTCAWSILLFTRITLFHGFMKIDAGEMMHCYRCNSCGYLWNHWHTRWDQMHRTIVSFSCFPNHTRHKNIWHIDHMNK